MCSKKSGSRFLVTSLPQKQRDLAPQKQRDLVLGMTSFAFPSHDFALVTKPYILLFSLAFLCVPLCPPWCKIRVHKEPDPDSSPAPRRGFGMTSFAFTSHEFALVTKPYILLFSLAFLCVPLRPPWCKIRVHKGPDPDSSPACRRVRNDKPRFPVSRLTSHALLFFTSHLSRPKVFPDACSLSPAAYFFFPTLSSMSTVMASRSYFGAKPHSAFAAEQSSELGHDSAMPCLTGSTS